MKFHLLLILGLSLFFYGCKKETAEPYSIFNGDWDELQEGDLAFRKGRGTASQLINLADKRGIYSHIGIIIKDSVQGWVVVHMVPGEQEETDGIEVIKKEPLDLFFCSDRSSAGGIYRIDLEESQRITIKVNAEEWFKKKIIFDHNFNPADSTRMYCTELVYHVFNQTGKDLTENRRHSIVGFRYKLILPSDILQNESLKEIYTFSVN